MRGRPIFENKRILFEYTAISLELCIRHQTKLLWNLKNDWYYESKDYYYRLSHLVGRGLL